MAERDPREIPPERDEVSRLYRQLPREEPPASLDASIRSQAHRAGTTHPAPLVPPTGRRNWYFPVAAAAVIVLAVAVTWQVEREQGDPLTAQTARVEPEPERVESKKEDPQPAQAKPQAQARAQRAEKPSPRLAPEPAADEGTKDLAKAQAAEESQERKADAAAASPRRDSNVAGAAARQRSEVQPQGMVLAQLPEPWLERIAQLRKEGRHDEADRELEAFRKLYPDFALTPEMLEKVGRP